MTDIASIGFKMETDDVARGIKSLETLAQQGPKVEKALDGVEKTAAKAGKSLKSIGEGTGKGLDEVGRAAPKAAEGVGRVAKSADDAKKALSGMGASTAGLGAVATSAGLAGRGLASMATATTQAGAGLNGFGAGLKSVQQMMREMQTQATASAQAAAQMASVTTAAAASMNAMAKAQADATRTAQEMARVFQAVGVHAKDGAVGVRNMAEASSGLNSNMRLAAQGVQALLGLQIVGWAKDSAVAMFQASAAAERLRIGLDFASVRGSADEIAYLRKTTDGLGLSFASTAQSYMQFQAAAKGTSIEGDKARAVFESVAKASAVMGLSAEQNSGVLLALQQMVSKGTVQAEELRGQLGERLPGAFQIAARAMGVTTAELGKMLEMGQVVSEDFLPKFAKELEKSLGGAAENAANRLDASVNRFDNAWERMKQKAGDSGVSKAIAGELDAVARDMQAITEAVEGASNKGAGALSALGQGAVVAAGRTGFATLNLMANTLNGTINLLTGDLLGLRTNLAVLPDVFKTNAEQVKILGVDMEGAQSKLKRLQELDAMPSNGNYYKTAIADTNAYIAKLREAIELRSGLAGAGVPAAPGGDPYNDGTSYGVYKGALAAADAALKATSSFKSQAEQLAEVRKQGDAARKALKGLEEQGEGTGEKANELRERLKGVDERLASIAKRGQSGAASAAKAANQELEQQASLLAELSGLSGSFYKDWESLSKQYAQGRISLKGLEEAQAALLAKQPAMVALAKEEAEVSKARVKAWEEEVKGWQKQVEERNKAAESAEDALLKARDEEQAHALAAAANITHAEAVARLTLARAEDNYQKALSRGSDGETLLALQRETDARRGLVEVMQQKGVREANEKAAETISKEWEKASQLIGDTLSDYIMGGGKDAAQYLKRLFATLVLQPVVQYGVNSAMGALGMGQQGSAVQSVLGGNNVGSTVLNNAGAIGAGYQAMFGASVGASSASLFGANAVGLMGGDALGTLAAANGMWAGVATGAQATAQAAVAANLALEAGTAVALEAGTLGTAIGTGATGVAAGASSMMAGVMAAAPYLAAVVALYAIIAGMDDSGTPHSGAGAVYSKATGVQSGAEIYNQGTFGMGHRDEYSQDMQAGISGIAQGLGQTLDAFAVSFGKTAGYSVATAFADDSSKDGSWGSLKIADELGKVLVNWEDSRASKWAPREFADGEAGYKEYLNAVAVDVKNAFVSMDLPAWADQILTTATDIDTLNAALQQIATVKSVFDGLSKTMGMFADLSGDLQTRLLAASGGVEALASNAGSFYESFYTEGERALKQRELQMAALAGMGLYIDPAEGDAAKAAFKKTVQDAMESGQVELAAQLLAMSGAFASTADYAQKVLADMESAAKSAAEAAAKAATEAAEAAQAGRETAADNAWANVQAAIDREKEYWSEIAGASQTAIAALSGSLSLLTSNARELYGTVDSAQQMLAAQGMVYIENALSSVRGGASAADFTGLQDAIGASRSGISAGVYVSDFERQRDTLVLAGQLAELGDLTDNQLSVEQRALDAAQEQIKQLDMTLDYWQQQVDGTAQLIDASLSIEGAISALGAALAAREAGKAAAGGGAGGSSGGIVSDSMLKTVGDAWAAGDWITAQNYIRGQGISNDQLQGAFDLNYADLRYLFEQGITTQNPGTYSFKSTTPEGVYSEAKAQGLSLSEVNALLGAGAGEAEDWAKKMGLPIFHEGTNYVPRTGFAVLQEGEQVVPRAFNPYAGGGAQQGSNAELIAEVRALRAEVAALRAPMEQTAQATTQQANQFDNATAGGNAMAVEVMA